MILPATEGLKYIKEEGLKSIKQAIRKYSKKYDRFYLMVIARPFEDTGKLTVKTNISVMSEDYLQRSLKKPATKMRVDEILTYDNTMLFFVNSKSGKVELVRSLAKGEPTTEFEAASKQQLNQNIRS